MDLAFQLPPLPDSVRRVVALSVAGRYARVGSAAARFMLPDQFSFEQNYPNPFNPSTTFRFALPTPGPVKLEIFNVLGQKVTTLLDRRYEAGEWEYNWNGEVGGGSLASGVYLARLTAGSQTATRKMVVVK